MNDIAPSPGPGPLLAVRGLRKLYPVGRPAAPWRRGAHRALLHAVDDVSFTIGRGETVGLVGEFRLRQVDRGSASRPAD